MGQAQIQYPPVEKEKDASCEECCIDFMPGDLLALDAFCPQTRDSQQHVLFEGEVLEYEVYENGTDGGKKTDEGEVWI